MEKHPWQVRAKAAGLSQKTLAALLGHAEITISRQLRGQWNDGVVPVHVQSAIIAWELMTDAQRVAWVTAITQVPSPTPD